MIANFNGFRELDIGDVETATEILELQRESYKVEAKLIGSEEIPPLKETVQQLVSSGEHFLGYYVKGTLGAVLSYKRMGAEVDIHRLMVHPRQFRRGMAISLLEYLERTERGVQKYHVSTGAANGPAIRLYQKLGFEFMDETVVESGLRLAHLKKQNVR